MAYVIGTLVVYDDITHQLSGHIKSEVIIERLGIKESEILKVLCIHSGQIVDRKALINSAWPDAISADVNLNGAILSLRRKLASFELDVIKTVPRVGYLLECDVIEAEHKENNIINDCLISQDKIEKNEVSCTSVTDEGLAGLSAISNEVADRTIDSALAADRIEHDICREPIVGGVIDGDKLPGQSVRSRGSIAKFLSVGQSSSCYAIKWSFIVMTLSLSVLLCIRFFYMDRMKVVVVGENKIVGYSSILTPDVISTIEHSLSQTKISNLYVAVGKDFISFLSRHNPQKKVAFMYGAESERLLENLDGKLSLALPFLLDDEFGKEQLTSGEISYSIEKNIQLICGSDAKIKEDCIYAVSSKQITTKYDISKLEEHVEYFCGYPSSKPFFIYEIGGTINKKAIVVERIWYQKKEENLLTQSGVKKSLLLLLIDSLTDDKRKFKLWEMEANIYFSDSFRSGIYHFNF